jgi:anti-anti-sigma factor
MKIATSQKGKVLVLALQGSLDVITSPDLEKKVQEAIDGGERRLVFDLSRLDYVSSAGLRAFMVGVKQMTAAGGHLRFCCLSKAVRQVFDIAGLSFRLGLYPSLEAATADFPEPT